MKKLVIFAFAGFLCSCSSTKQEVSPLLQKKYYRAIVMDVDSTEVKESKIVEL